MPRLRLFEPTTLSIVDGALDLGYDKRRPLQIGMALASARLERARNTPMPIGEDPRGRTGHGDSMSLL
jgi:hypothetical protein